MPARTAALAAALAAALLSPAAEPNVDLYGDPLPPGAVMRLGSLRHRTGARFTHGERVYLPGGRTLLVNEYTQLRWFDADTGQETDCWTPPAGWQIHGLSADGRLALLSDLHTIQVWDVPARREVRALKKLRAYTGGLTTTFSPDARSVVIQDLDEQMQHCLRFWDLATGRELWRGDRIGEPGKRVSVFGFRPDGRTLVAVDGNGVNTSVFILDRATGQVVRSFQATLNYNALSPDGAMLLTDAGRPGIRCWDLETGRECPGFGDDVPAHGPLTFSADGTRLVTGGPDGTALVWDWPARQLVRRINLGMNSPGWLGFTPDGKRLEGGASGESLTRFWDLQTGRPIPPPDGHGGLVRAVRFLPDGTVLSAEQGAFRTWDAATGRTLQQVPVPAMTGVRFISADGRVMLVAHDGSADAPWAEIRDIATGRVLNTVPRYSQGVPVAALDPGGRRMAVVLPRHIMPGGPFDIPLWDIATRREICRLDHPGGWHLVFSPDGQFLATAGVGVRLWDTASGRLVWAVGDDGLGRQIYSLAFTPDGRSLAVMTEGRITVYELAGGGERWRAEVRGVGNSSGSNETVAVSPDGRWLAAQNRSNGVRVWDAHTGQPAQELTGHRGGITSLAFAPDGRTLATGSWDTTVLIWAVPDRPCPAAPLTAAAAAAAWDELAGGAAVAFRAMGRLSADPGGAIPLLRDRLLAPTAVSPEQIDRWVAELDDDRFAVRRAATRGLEMAGEHAALALRLLLAGRPSPEARQRAERLLAKLEEPSSADPETLRKLRAVEVLERLGTPAARDLLADLAKGDAAAPLAREARASLERLRGRP
jgi:WD40 repeat protein